MNYLQSRKRKRKQLKFVSVVVLLAVIIFAFNKPIFRGLSSASHAVFKPILRLAHDSSPGGEGVNIILQSKRELAEENEELKLKMKEQEVQLANYNTILNENLELKETLNRSPEDLDFILASILTKPNTSPYDTLLVDIGSNDGVSEGALVFGLGNVPLGRVAEVFANSAKVVLFSSPGVETQASSSKDNIYAILYGRGSGNFEVSLPRDTEIDEGVEFSLPGIYPYTIATVQSTISDPRASFLKILLASPINIQEIKFVQILR